MRTERAEPILPSRDLQETRAFYQKLGFALWFKERPHWEYEIASRGHLVVQFYTDAALKPGENSAGCYWRVNDVDRFYQECAALDLPSEGIPRLTVPRDQQWGMREFALVDPSGNLIRVGHDLNPASAYDPGDA